MFNWLGEMLGTNEVGRRIRELEDQVSTLGDQVVRLEDRVTSLERSTTLTLEDFGDYKSRTNEELKLMELQITRLLDHINDVLSTLDSIDGITRAKRLQSRLRNHRTRIRNAQEAHVG
jgi:predicted  nucleic acid-binding Zn-ribbon protein